MNYAKKISINLLAQKEPKSACKIIGEIDSRERVRCEKKIIQVCLEKGELSVLFYIELN